MAGRTTLVSAVRPCRIRENVVKFPLKFCDDLCMLGAEELLLAVVWGGGVPPFFILFYFIKTSRASVLCSRFVIRA